MKKLLALFFICTILVSCGPSQRFLDLENRVFENESKIQTLYNREEYNPVIADSYITLMKMSTVVVSSKRDGDTYNTSGFGVQVKEAVDEKELDIVYVWTVAHSIVQSTMVENEETKKLEHVFVEHDSVRVVFRAGTPLVASKEAEVVSYDLSLDLALLRVDVTDSGIVIPDVSFAEERRKTGSPTMFITTAPPFMYENLQSSNVIFSPGHAQ